MYKICFCVDTMGSGGAERVVATLSNQFIKMGHEVTIIMVAALEKKTFYDLDSHIQLIALCEGQNKIKNPFIRVKLLRECIKQSKAEIVISFLPNANIYTSFALRRLHIPHIVSERNNPYSDPKNRLMRILKKRAFCKAQACVFQTLEAQAYYNKKIQSKGYVIRNPIKLNANFGCDNRKKIVLSVGRLVEQKNISLLLRAFALFYKKHSDFKLVIYGEGECKEELQQLTDDIGINKSVEFRGNSPNWQSEAKDSAMFVLSSDYEGMPNALMEAMALGIACISTDCLIGAPRELIADGSNGFLVPVGNEEVLSKKMSLIADNDSISTKFQEANRDMEQVLSAETISKQWLDLIQTLL